jgi:hypothetical protein
VVFALQSSSVVVNAVVVFIQPAQVDCRSPTALDPVLLQRLLEAHQRHPDWGPRKLLRLVGDRWPAPAAQG